MYNDIPYIDPMEVQTCAPKNTWLGVIFQRLRRFGVPGAVRARGSRNACAVACGSVRVVFFETAGVFLRRFFFWDDYFM